MNRKEREKKQQNYFETLQLLQRIAELEKRLAELEILLAKAEKQVEDYRQIIDSNKKKQFYYAVAKGRKTGIFYSWEEAKKQVDGFSEAKHHKFESEGAAKAYLANYNDEIPEWQRELNLLDSNWD